MNLAIIETAKNSRIKTAGLKSSKGMMKIKGEYLIERLIRIGSNNGITRVFCITDSNQKELENYLSANNSGIPARLIVPEPGIAVHVLFALASVHNKEPFFLVNINSVFSESEFAEFVTYSLLHEDADGAIAVTKHYNDKNPLSVAMNAEDSILKFNDSKAGYSWVNGGLYYFSPRILNETKYALEIGISRIEEFLQLLIARKYILKGFSFSKIIKVENAGDIAEAEDLVSGNII